MTRLYSPKLPNSVDVFYYYLSQSRYNTVDWDVRIRVRLNKPVKKNLDLPQSAFAMSCSGEWFPLLDLSYDESSYGRRHWNPIEDRSIGLRKADLERIHKALWGEIDLAESDEELEVNPSDATMGSEDTAPSIPLINPAEKIKMLHTVNLLFASVGIGLKVARTKKGHDEFRNKYIQWALTDSEWFGVNMRKVAGCPLPRDKEYKKERPSTKEMWGESEDGEDARSVYSY